MKKKILYIEDNQYNIILVKKILESENYQFYQAMSGFEGIKVANEVNPDLILMDINLPDLSGLEVTTKIKNIPLLINTKIIAFTAEIGEGAKEKTLAAGCDGYISKPIDNTFKEKIKEAFLGKNELINDSAKEIKILREYSKDLVDKLFSKYKELENANLELENSFKTIQMVNKKLVLLNKMEENFIAISSHELRTPIVVIKGFIDLFLDGAFGEMSQKQKEIFIVLQTNVSKLIKLIEDITTFADFNNQDLTISISKENIGQLLKDIVNEFKNNLMKRNLTFSMDMKIDNPEFYIEKTLITLAVQNLVNNAIKYTKDGGMITIGALEENDKYKIFVKDNGIGIEREYLERIFDKFFTIQDSSHYFSGDYEFMAGGKGLGLSIVKSIAKIHQGETWAESEGKDKGSTLFITIPKNLKRLLKRNMSVHEEEKYIYSINWPYVLDYVNPDLYEIAIISFDDFLSKFDSIKPPSLFIFDISEIPEEKILETIVRIKTLEKFLFIPVIIIDKENNVHRKSQLYKIGIEEYLVKPFEKESIISLFTSLL